MHNKAPRPKFVIQATDSVIGGHTKKLKEQILKQIPVDDPKKQSSYVLTCVLQLVKGQKLL